MQATHKENIATEIQHLVVRSSQERVATRAGVSTATINHMVNGKWDLIKDSLWQKVQTTLKIDFEWKHSDTANYLDFLQLLTATQERNLSIAISMKEGRSKSHSYKRYQRMNENVIYVECKNYWTKKTYVQALLTAIGQKADGTVGELIEEFISQVSMLNNPIIIIDQADKLKDPQLDLFMDLYNDLEGRCAFVLSGVPALSKRILRGVQRDKSGYREIYSRIGRSFITLPEINKKDVAGICIANGIEDADMHIEIFNQCDGDMRRVRRLIERTHLSTRQNEVKKSN